MPVDRLMAVRTDRIGAEIERIANFVGVPAHHLDTGRSHLFRAPSEFGFIDQIEPAFLEETVDRFGRDIMHSIFPEIGAAADVLDLRRDLQTLQ